ncbi:P-loop containing nucleoside triphosphate hydrolase protein [Mycotypha africana]|uniref:P-loop containing nucleoside triphosphate hydrolase protein n=1 Tax=Mycotypha africana TaxID=64632 RepID=UPI002301254D|nr:P-loop containing nucleoside triphosphate hydrolase protein [Mycotypha africana]KAI8970118.1 P-loop containing nucleoside triphosphate hydrolase protein [Mycotypha africana]
MSKLVEKKKPTTKKVIQKKGHKKNKKKFLVKKATWQTKPTKEKQQEKESNPALEKGVDGVIEYEDLGNIDTWDWNDSNVTDTFLSDDLGGFVCLEEISDVEVEYEGDDNTGKVAKFKRIKKTDRKHGKKANPTAPLSLEETQNFYDLDTFDESLVNDENTEDADANVDADKPLKTQEDDHVENEKKEGSVVSIDGKAGSDDDDNNDKKVPTANSKKLKTEKPAENNKVIERKEKTDEKKSKVEKTTAVEKKVRPTVDDVDQTVDISAWDSLNLCTPIRNALKYNQFTEPTPIQLQALPLAMDGRDIVGSAETGSGKTLAFGLPIIHYLATHGRGQKGGVKNGLGGLILTPTRELAIQVRDHIEKMSVFTDIRTVAIVGGMSIQKQQRLLKQQPDIIVATPGRLWELFSEDHEYMDMLKHIKFLVLDEADRMLEKGHFEELTSLLSAISNKRQNTTEWPEQLDSDGGFKKILPQDVGVHQTFIYTATLSKDIRFNVKAKKRKVLHKENNTMEDLLERIEFADEKPALVDVTSEDVVASKLLEAKVECLHTEKDLYVYYFVTRYPGRTILFVNSIDAIRRLVPVFKLLNIEVLGLHAQMQQKQRLKNLDRFKANPKAVLVASDVAARGLDIPMVEHVIHYQLPRSGEIYVHRSGRTARANREGISLLLCSPEEVKIYKKLCQTLRKNEEYPNFPVDLSILRAMKERVRVATEIDSLQHQEAKQTHETNWMRNMAKEMDIEFDEETMQGKGHQKSDKELEKARVKVMNLKNQLHQLLKQPILPAGVSAKFLTGGVIADLAERLLNNDDQKLLPASTKTKAIEDLHQAKKRKSSHN